MMRESLKAKHSNISVRLNKQKAAIIAAFYVLGDDAFYVLGDEEVSARIGSFVVFRELVELLRNHASCPSCEYQVSVQ